MKTNTVITIVLICGLIRFKGVSSEMSAVLVDKCRFTKFCTQEASPVLENPDKDPCCLPCFCSSKCSLIDRCCPDVESKNETTMVYPCRNLHAISIKYKYVFFYPYRRPFDLKMSYNVIDGCPPEVVSQPGFSNRVSNCYNANDLEDIRFVTGDASKLTYLNKHCAFCNQEVNFTEWKLYLTSSHLLISDLSDDKIFRDILKSGVYPLPPSHVIGLNNLCFPTSNNIITTCNITGRWNYYDRAIEKKCSDIKVPYADLDDYAEGYANVYCFLCNSPKNQNVDTQCRKKKLDGHILSERVGLIKFSAVLVSKPTEEKATLCDLKEIWDPFRMMCRDLYCPLGMSAYNGRCVQLVADVLDYIVEISIEFTVERYVNLNWIKPTQLISDLLEYFKSSTNNLCKPCTFDVYATSGRGVIKAQLATWGKCSLTNMLESLSVFVSNNTVNVYLATTQLKITLSNFIHKPILDFKLLKYKGKGVLLTLKRCNVSDLVFSSNTIYCPSIALTSTDMLAFSTNVSAVILSRSVQIDMATVRICLKDYFSILDKFQIKVWNGSPEDNIMPRMILLALGQIMCLVWA